MKSEISLKPFRIVGSMVAALGIATATLAVGHMARADSTTYTTDADFDLGMLNGVNHDPPNNDQLQPNIPPGTTFPILWIANAGEDSVSKIDTDAASTFVPSGGCEIARYRTGVGPPGVPGSIFQPHSPFAGPAPSRTTVDIDGNVYIANRHFDGKPAEVVKILTDGFIDRNGNGMIDTSIDANGNCQIEPSEILALEDTNLDGVIQDSEIQDERIAWIVQVGPNNGVGRSLCIDGGGNIWLGLFNTREYFQLNPADGSILAGPVSSGNVNPYGCLVDAQGRLWSASLSTRLAEIDTNTQTFTANHNNTVSPDYGIALGSDKVYLANRAGRGFTEFDPATNTFSAPAPLTTSTLGISVDAGGDIVLGQTTIFKFTPAGAVVWGPVANPSGSGQTRGVVVDADNNIWVVNLTSNNVTKFDGTTGALLGTLPVGASPYTYSDATGFAVRNITTPTGIWTIVQDSGEVGTEWQGVSWTEDVPPDASITTRVRAADTVAGLDLQSFVLVPNGGDPNLTGRFVEAQVRLTAPGPGIAGPTLFDFTVDFKLPNSPPVADAGPDQIVECSLPGSAEVSLDGTGSFDPDDDPLTYNWSTSAGPLTGPTPTVVLTLGMETIVLTVDDGRGETDSDTVDITVEDTTAPAVTASLTPVGLGDDDDDDGDEGRLRINFAASDVCDPDLTVTAVLMLPGRPDIPVVDGQIIEFEQDDDSEVEHDDGILEIEAASLTLKATATDASGNEGAAEDQAGGASGDDDDSLASADIDG